MEKGFMEGDIQLIVVRIAHRKSLLCRFPGKPSRLPLENDFSFRGHSLAKVESCMRGF